MQHAQTATTSPSRPTTRAFDVARAVFGLHRRVRIGSVLYTERNSRSLERTLSEGGVKAYDVSFEHAPAMRIRVSSLRPYPDLTGPDAVEPYHLLISHVLPGERVLDARCGSGYGAAVLADLVGPAGAVIAMDTDPEFIRYAKRRYPADHVGFELGQVDTLFGELDGSFNTTLLRLDSSPVLPPPAITSAALPAVESAGEPVAQPAAEPAAASGSARESPVENEHPELSILPELLRVTAPGGKLILLLKIPADSFPSSDSVQSDADPDHPVLAHLKLMPCITSLCGVRKPGSDWAAIIAYKSQSL